MRVPNQLAKNLDAGHQNPLPHLVSLVRLRASHGRSRRGVHLLEDECRHKKCRSYLWERIADEGLGQRMLRALTLPKNKPAPSSDSHSQSQPPDHTNCRTRAPVLRSPLAELQAAKDSR